MLPKSKLRRSALCLMLALAALSAGCEQARRDLAAAISPDTTPNTLRNVRQKIANGQFKAARAEGEAFLARRIEETGVLAWELSKACVQLGDNEQAIRFVEQAIRARVVSGIDLLSEPMLEPLRNDPRLVALASSFGAADGRPVEGGAAAKPPGREKSASLPQ